MQHIREISIEIFYEKHSDGRYYIKSHDLPGFRLEGTNLKALQDDLDSVVKDLLKLNSNFIVDTLRWVPSPEDAARQLENPEPEGKAIYVARAKAAA